jgi:hypothetical protein
MSGTGKMKTNAVMNYRADIITILPFLMMLATGVVIQAVYHFGHCPAEYPVLGIARTGWVSVHRLSSAASLACVAVHLYLHREYIRNVLVKKSSRRRAGKVRENFWLLVIFTVTSLTGVVSWLFLAAPASRAVIEIHDKLGLALVVLSIHHVAHRLGWLKKRTEERFGR